MYAIIKTGGKQYKVAKRTVFLVEKLDVEDGDVYNNHSTYHEGDAGLDLFILKREVIIHNYIGISPERNKYTCDEKIYHEIMIKKKEIVTEIEKLLKKVSIDYFLWDYKKSPKSHSKSSHISVTSAENKLQMLIDMKRNQKAIKTSCPKPRRPKNEKCINPKYPYMYKNKKGN